VASLPFTLTAWYYPCRNSIGCYGLDSGWLPFLDIFTNCEKRLLASSCLSVRTEKLGSRWTDFHEIWFLHIFSESLSIKFKFHQNLRIMGTLQKNLWAFMVVFHITLTLIFTGAISPDTDFISTLPVRKIWRKS